MMASRFRLAVISLLVAKWCGGAPPPDTGLDYAGLATVQHGGHRWLCAFNNEDKGARPGYKVVWRITLVPLDPSFLKTWYGDQVYKGKIKVTGTPQGHMVMQFGDWLID